MIYSYLITNLLFFIQSIKTIFEHLLLVECDSPVWKVE